MSLTSLYQHLILPAYETHYQGRNTLSYWQGLEQSQWFHRERLEAIQFTALERILAHAAKNCPYYRKQWSQLGLHPDQLQNFDDFRAWPVLGKDTIRAHRAGMNSEVPLGKMLAKSTGGSTGVPVHFDLDMGSHERRTAAMYRGYGWAGGAPGTKQFHLWGVPLVERSRRQQWKDWLFNVIQRKHLVSAFDLSLATAPRIADELNRCRPDVVVAYAGALYQFARALDELRLTPYSPRSLIVGAEKLHPFQRETIEAVFQAPVFETYGSREFMLIGGECPEHHGLHLTMEQLYVEILDDDGRPTRTGEVGNVVVTDLYNYGMPFIRYAIGDQAVAGWDMCRCGRGLPLMREVSGRRLDSLQTPDGRTVPGAYFPHLMKDYGAIRQFQVVQPALDRLELRVVLGTTWTESQRQNLLAKVAQTMGPQVAVDWRPVESIELTRAGKHRVVVSQLAARSASECQAS